MKTAVWKPNRKAVRELRRVIEQIQAEPRKFDMTQFIQLTGQVSCTPESLKPPCGTTACLAGHIAINEWMDKHDGQFPTRLRLIELTGKAESESVRILDLPSGATDKLFYHSRWPEPFRSTYVTYPYTMEQMQQNVELATQFIEHVIANGLEYQRPVRH